MSPSTPIQLGRGTTSTPKQLSTLGRGTTSTPKQLSTLSSKPSQPVQLSTITNITNAINNQSKSGATSQASKTVQNTTPTLSQQTKNVTQPTTSQIINLSKTIDTTAINTLRNQGSTLLKDLGLEPVMTVKTLPDKISSLDATYEEWKNLSQNLATTAIKTTTDALNKLIQGGALQDVTPAEAKKTIDMLKNITIQNLNTLIKSDAAIKNVTNTAKLETIQINEDAMKASLMGKGYDIEKAEPVSIKLKMPTETGSVYNQYKKLASSLGYSEYTHEIDLTKGNNWTKAMSVIKNTPELGKYLEVTTLSDTNLITLKPEAIKRLTTETGMDERYIKGGVTRSAWNQLYNANKVTYDDILDLKSYGEGKAKIPYVIEGYDPAKNRLVVGDYYIGTGKAEISEKQEQKQIATPVTQPVGATITAEMLTPKAVMKRWEETHPGAQPIGEKQIKYIETGESVSGISKAISGLPIIGTWFTPDRSALMQKGDMQKETTITEKPGEKSWSVWNAVEFLSHALSGDSVDEAWNKSFGKTSVEYKPTQQGVNKANAMITAINEQTSKGVPVSSALDNTAKRYGLTPEEAQTLILESARYDDTTKAQLAASPSTLRFLEYNPFTKDIVQNLYDDKTLETARNVQLSGKDIEYMNSRYITSMVREFMGSPVSDNPVLNMAIFAVGMPIKGGGKAAQELKVVGKLLSDKNVVTKLDDAYKLTQTATKPMTTTELSKVVQENKLVAEYIKNNPVWVKTAIETGDPDRIKVVTTAAKTTEKEPVRAAGAIIDTYTKGTKLEDLNLQKVATAVKQVDPEVGRNIERRTSEHGTVAVLSKNYDEVLKGAGIDPESTRKLILRTSETRGVGVSEIKLGDISKQAEKLLSKETKLDETELVKLVTNPRVDKDRITEELGSIILTKHDGDVKKATEYLENVKSMIENDKIKPPKGIQKTELINTLDRIKIQEMVTPKIEAAITKIETATPKIETTIPRMETPSIYKEDAAKRIASKLKANEPIGRTEINAILSSPEMIRKTIDASGGQNIGLTMVNSIRRMLVEGEMSINEARSLLKKIEENIDIICEKIC